jgi:glycosyltransferase involved in cell wall biosynthesis
MKKNVLHLTFDMHIGGTEQVISNLVQATDQAQFNTSILCIESPIGPFGEMLIARGVKIEAIPRKSGFDFGLVLKIRKCLRDNEIDILHCHQYTPWAYGLLASLASHVRVIFTEHGRFYPDRSSWKRRFVNPLLVRYTDAITAISRATKQALTEYEYIPQNRIEVVYNGIQPLSPDTKGTEKLRSELGIDRSTQILGTISRLDPIKNHRLLFNAYSELVKTHPDTVLVIVGDGPIRHELESQVTELGISQRVIFTGFQPEPANYLKMFDIFLLPSLSEGTAITLLEAMSLSKPSIVTNVGGNPEIIRQMENGLVVPTDQVDSLVEACRQLLDDESKQHDMGQAAKALFDQEFTVKQMTEKYQSIYLNS